MNQIPQSQAIVPRAGAQITRGFGTEELRVQAELAAVAAGEQARAMVQARYMMAMQRPRDFDLVRSRLLDECKRPRFADSAIYAKPVGGKAIEGLSIRFAEAALRQLGNILCTSFTITETAEIRQIRVQVTDLETNATFEEDLIVAKTVERKSCNKREADVIGERSNSYGEKVYVLRATEDEILTKAAAQVSKKVRNCGLRLLPGDLKDEARDACEATLQEETTRDLPGKRQRMVAAFGGLQPPVSAAVLGRYLGHDPNQATVEEMIELGRVRTAIIDGETTWDATFEQRASERRPAPVAASTTEAPAVAEHVSPHGTVKIVDEVEPQAFSNPSNEPQAGTPDFATWLMARMRDMKAMGSLRALANTSRRLRDCPESTHADVKAEYEACRQAIQARGAK